MIDLGSTTLEPESSVTTLELLHVEEVSTTKIKAGPCQYGRVGQLSFPQTAHL